MDHVAMTNSDRLTTNEVLGMLGFSVWHLQQVRVVWMTILHYMNLDKDVAVVIMDSFTLINIFDPVWLYSLAHGNAVVHGEVETGEAGGSEGSHVTDYTAPLSNASSSDVAVQFPTGADSGESNESSGPDVASFVEFYENN